MKTSKLQQHPLIDLLINEDGTRIIYKGKTLEVKIYQQPDKHYPVKRVNFMNRTHSVPKLICESWNGMRANITDTVHRKDRDPLNDHYTNLYWGKRGKVQTNRTARSKLSKIKPAEVSNIIKRLKYGESLHNIARSYNTSDMSVYRIKLRFLKDKRLKLKHAIIWALNEYERQQAYSVYMGYKNLATAISALGSEEFKQQTDKIATQL